MKNGDKQNINPTQFAHGQPIEIITHDGESHIGQFIDRGKDEIFAVMQFAVMYQQARSKPGASFKDKKYIMLMLDNEFNSIDTSEIASIKKITVKKCAKALTDKRNEKYETGAEEYRKDFCVIAHDLAGRDRECFANDLIQPLENVCKEIIEEAKKDDYSHGFAFENTMRSNLIYLKNDINAQIGRSLDWSDGKYKMYDTYVHKGKGPLLKITWPTPETHTPMPIQNMERLIQALYPKNKTWSKQLDEAYEKREMFSMAVHDDQIYLSLLPEKHPIPSMDERRYHYIPIQEYFDIKSGKQQAPKKQESKIQMTVTSFPLDLEKLQK